LNPNRRMLRIAGLLVVTVLANASSCKVEECDCPRGSAEVMTIADYEDLLEQMVESGDIDPGSKEYKRLSKRIRKGKDLSLLFGDNWRDLGYEPDTLWTVPATVSQNCPFEIHWRPCFQGEECRYPVPPESGAFSEMLRVEPDDPGLDTGMTFIGVVTESFERPTIVNGECMEYVYEHPGIGKAGIWNISITAYEPENADCPGFGGIDVTENDTRILQIEVGCFCGKQDSYNLAMLTLPYLDFSTNDLRWNLQFPFVTCASNPPETLLLSEHLLITRTSDGVEVVDQTEPFSMTMGATAGHSYPLYGAALEEGVEYTMTVEVTGGDCSCEDRGYGDDNVQTLTFSF